MKFNCGPTLREREIARILAARAWHLWFAWYPVRITGTHTCVWFARVLRRDNGGFASRWDYKETT